MQPDWLKWMTELQAIAQNGLAYANNPYDIHRFETIRHISAEIAAQYANLPHQEVIELFAAEISYATPKIDVRGAVFRDNKILLVKERADDLWTLPGGFADVNESPSESCIREIVEESGYETKAVKLLAFYDMRKHDHPRQWPHIYKAVFLCELTGGEAKTSIETSDVSFFAENEIPDLSLPRVTPVQISRFFEHAKHPEWPTDFD